MCLSSDTKNTEPQGTVQTELQGCVAADDNMLTVLYVWDSERSGVRNA